MRTYALIRKFIQDLCIKLLNEFDETIMYTIDVSPIYLPQDILISEIELIVMNTINEDSIRSEIIKIYRIYSGILDTYELYFLDFVGISNFERIMNDIPKLYALENIFNCSIDISDDKIKKIVIKRFDRGYRKYFRMNVSDFANAVEHEYFEEILTANDPWDVNSRKIRLIYAYSRFLEEVFIFKIIRFRKNL
jgi:hypothetical protein